MRADRRRSGRRTSGDRHRQGVRRVDRLGTPRPLGATLDREDLVCVTSPVVLPAAVVAALDGLDTDDLAALVARLSERFPVRHLQAPPLGRRIVGESDLEVLVALSRAAG